MAWILEARKTGEGNSYLQYHSRPNFLSKYKNAKPRALICALHAQATFRSPITYMDLKESDYCTVRFESTEANHKIKKVV